GSAPRTGRPGRHPAKARPRIDGYTARPTAAQQLKQNRVIVEQGENVQCLILTPTEAWTTSEDTGERDVQGIPVQPLVQLRSYSPSDSRPPPTCWHCWKNKRRPSESKRDRGAGEGQHHRLPGRDRTEGEIEAGNLAVRIEMLEAVLKQRNGG